MKVIGLFLYAALIYSCNGTSQQKAAVKAIDRDLQIGNKITLTNTYTKSGLLDISYKTDSIFLKGFVMANNYFITREYDSNNNLLREKTFGSEINELTEETIFSYDSKNNLISEIHKSFEITISITKIYYNEQNQETKRIVMHNTQSDHPELDVKKQSNSLFDTIIKVNFYDQQGNLIKQTASNSNNVVQFNLFTFYANGQKTITYEVDENRDTTTMFRYKKVGNLIEEKVVSKSDPNSYVTTWYDGKKKVKRIFYDSNTNRKLMETYKYDKKGNEVENISYK